MKMCDCVCHDANVMHAMPCCAFTYEKRATVDNFEYLRNMVRQPPSHTPWQWVAPFSPPDVGSVVKIILNGWNAKGRHNDIGNITAIVEGYEIVEGWLMLWVRPMIRPPWHTKQSPERDIVMLAGIEVEPT